MLLCRARLRFLRQTASKPSANAGASRGRVRKHAGVSGIHHVILPLALILGACDSEDPEDAAEVAVTADADPDASTEREGKFAGKFATLDADGDGAISKAEIAGHKMAPLFAEIDGDGNGSVSKAEFIAAKKARHEGKGRPDHGNPAERAAKLLEKHDADKDGTLSKAEVEGHRFLDDKFAELDTDADGKLTAAELTAFKAKHHGRKHGGGGDKQAHG